MENETILDEKIEVVALFRSGRTMCEPLRFRRPNGQVVRVQEIGLRHPALQGNKTWHVFDVTDGQSEYRLELDSQRLVWRLTREAMYEQ